MKINNSITCKNCQTENASFELICRNCKSYLRERIVNIDLWNMIALIIENPSKGFKKIINSEHKNFIFFLLFLFTLKSLFNVIFISVIAMENSDPYNNFFLNYLILTAVISVTIYFFSFFIKLIGKKIAFITRLKDIFAISIYSYLPYALALVLLFPLELILFGGDVFSNNPSPFQLKPATAYILIALEAAVICWSVFLCISAFYAQSKNIYYGLVSGITLNFILFTECYIASLFLFIY